MFIYVAYKEPAELTPLNHRRTSKVEEENAVEKLLMVNPNCPIRVMLEYLRNKCKLASNTEFDLCDEGGGLRSLFNYPTCVNVHDIFERKKVYYLIVLKTLEREGPPLPKGQDKDIIVPLPQLLHDNPRYVELQARVKRFMVTGDTSPSGVSAKGSTQSARRMKKKSTA